MKYKTVIETDYYKEFKFFEDGNGKYVVAKDAGVTASEWIPLYFTECEQELGHWIKFVVNRQHKIRCSKCDYVEYEYITHIRNYCPNCGAKMEEIDNDIR